MSSASSVNLSLKQPCADFIPPTQSIGVWLTQGHSCQRDLILALRQACFADQIHIVASHSIIRPDITSVADIAFLEPPLDERVDWVIEQAQRLNVKLIVAGRYGRTYLTEKHKFEQAGIRLMAGASSIEHLEQVNNKSLFTQTCTDAGLPVVPATTVSNAEQLIVAIADWASRGGVCVKPIKGVFAAGFWRLDPNAKAFDCFANSSNFKAHPQQFIDSYAQLETPPDYLVMPMLTGLECSVDMFCEHGKVKQAVVRYKQHDDNQRLSLNDPARDLAVKVAELFACDGLVNMQARYSAEGELYILEINPRPSGGIGYTMHSGVNLIATAVVHGLGITQQPTNTADISGSSALVRAITTSVRVDG